MSSTLSAIIQQGATAVEVIVRLQVSKKTPTNHFPNNPADQKKTSKPLGLC